jgi:hypothetical protein
MREVDRRMAQHSRPNYFLLLGIGPDDAWDAAGFGPLLRARRSQWSRTVNNGVTTSNAVLVAQDAINRFDDIARVMTDPARRELERADAHVRLRDERLRRRVQLERDLRIMLGKGFLWEAEVAALRRNYPDLLTDRELADRIDHLPTRGIAEEHAIPDQLDPAKSNTIRSQLSLLGHKSLYTLLATVEPGIDERATSERLTRAANGLYQQTQRDMNKQDPRLLARQELAGHAMHIFGSAEDRIRYDNTLALMPVVELIASYQSALALVKRFEVGQVEGFLAEASAAGADAAVALAMLLKHFGMLKWTVLLPADAIQQARHDQVRCEACQAWNDTENEFCTVCGTRMRITCPSCGDTVAGHGACGGCGFPVGDYDWATLLVRECTELLDQQDLPGAEERFALAARAWPSDGDDELAARLGECRTRLGHLREQRAAEAENTARQLRALTGQRNYQAALNKATNAPATVPDRERVIQEATEHIREADRLCDVATRSGTSSRAQVDHYTQALAHCADHRRAQLALATLPPEPPAELRAEPADGVVRLTWTPSTSDNVRYVIVRRPGTTTPVSVRDGSRVATVRRTTYEDGAPEQGMPLHYAVFAQRATGTASESGAATTEPVFLTGRVVITAQRVDDGAVELEWQLPVHATGVAVRRTIAGETTDVSVTEQTRLRDENLANGVSHTYTVRAGYADPHGTTRLSAGVPVTLIPGPPPAPPGPVHVRTVTRNLGLCYRLVDLLPQGAAPGTANVLWTQQQPPVRPGEQHPVTTLATYGSLLTETAARSFALPRQGLYYFTQVMIQNGTGYLGDIRRYAARDEIGEISAQNLGDTIRLTWAWPDGSTAAMVAYDHDDWPPDPTVAPHHVLVDRVGNDRTGTYDIVGTTPESEQAFHFVVATADRRDGEVFVAGGTRCTARLTPAKQGRSRLKPRRKRR